MKAKYQSGTSFCIEIFDSTSRTCMTIANAVRLKEELTKAIDDAEKDKKEELTEFEIRLLDWLSNDTSGEIPMERMKKVVRNRAAELHSLARKEFENEAPSIIEAQSFKAGFKAGKAEALKDFPRWKRIRKGERLPETSYIWDFAYGERNGGGISTNWLLPNIPCVVGCDAWYIPVDVIKNLPREEEDEK